MTEKPDLFFDLGTDSLYISRGQEIRVMPMAHTHSHIEMNYLLSGRVDFLFGGRTAVLCAGELAFYWGAIPHQTTDVADGSRFVCIYVPLETFMAARLGDPLRSAVLGGQMVAATVPGQFAAGQFQQIFEDGKKIADCRIDDLLREEIQHIMRRVDVTGWRDLAAGPASGRAASGQPMNAQVVRMAKYIADYAHKAIGVEEIAAAAGIHPNYAMTLFRRTLGMTINDYLLRHRLMTAQALLISSRKSVATIAFEAGFGSISRFHDAFRNHFKCTPREFGKTVKRYG